MACLAGRDLCREMERDLCFLRNEVIQGTQLDIVQRGHFDNVSVLNEEIIGTQYRNDVASIS